jgi:hypothetical protein
MRGISRGDDTNTGHASQFSNVEASAGDAHRSATILSLLVFIWGALSLVIVPWEPFWIPDLSHTVVSAALLVYLIRTRTRPNRRAAEAICALLIVYALLLLPWTTVVWGRLGRPLEAFTIPQAAVVSIALVVPARWRLGIAALCLFFAESLFAYFYARYLGLEALIPITEPFATVGFAALGIGIFVLRRRRRDLVRRHVLAQAEVQALNRIRPQFERAREQLDTQITVLAAEVNQTSANGDGARSTVVGRALDRLADLRGKLGRLVSNPEVVTSPQEAERRMLEHDAQLGAILLAGCAVAVGPPILVWIHAQVGDGLGLLLMAPFLVDAVMLLYLVITRDRPSSRRALWATLVVVATVLPLITYNQKWLFELDRPYAPFLGHKLAMGLLGLTLATRFRIGIVLIVVIAASAIATWFALDLGAHHDIIVYSEPWVTLIYMLVGVVALLMREEWQIVSIQLVRAQTEASAMRRRALMFLALRDRLNSPLQTLVLGAAGATSHLPASGGERVQVAVDRLVSLSHELAQLDVLVPAPAAAFDADLELSRQI